MCNYHHGCSVISCMEQYYLRINRGFKDGRSGMLGAGEILLLCKGKYKEQNEPEDNVWVELARKGVWSGLKTGYKGKAKSYGYAKHICGQLSIWLCRP